jgi:hypothetical protein
MTKFGIDVSRWQGNFNFDQAKSEGVEFVIIKAGGGDDGLYRDSKFERNYANAKAAGLPVGAYFFGNATNPDEAVAEARKFLEILSGKQYEYPVYYDVEGKMLNIGKTVLTDTILAFCNTVERAGYYTGIYSGEWAFNNQIDDGRLLHFAHWVAKWASSKPKLKSGAKADIWQFGGETNKIRSNKIAGVVCDQNYCYVDYPEAMIRVGLNGYPKPDQKPEPTHEPAPEHSGFQVYVSTNYLNIRKGPGTDYDRTGEYTGRGNFWIVGTEAGKGSKDGWGQLEDGRGWIALDYAELI